MVVASLRNALFDLVGTLCNGSITAEEQERLGSLLSGNRDAQRFYVRYLDLHLALTDLDLLAHIDSDDLLPSLLAGLDAYDHDDVSASNALSHEQRQSSLPPLPPFLSPTLHNTLGYFSSGWTISYLSATVITGLLILGFWLMPASDPKQVARNAEPSVGC